MFGKRQRVGGAGRQRQPLGGAPTNVQYLGEISSVTSTSNYDGLAKVKGFIGEVGIGVLIDSGSSIYHLLVKKWFWNMVYPFKHQKRYLYKWPQKTQ